MRDLNIVPILDMLTTVIFFLLMSTTFIEYNKLTLPPAKTVTSTVQSDVEPLSPRLLVTFKGEALKLRLIWKGKNPGENEVESTPAEIGTKLQILLKQFAEKYPNEKTLQVSLEKDVSYQTLISIMDGSKDLIPDVVLLSYHEASQT